MTTFVNDSALFGGYPGSQNVIARSGDPAPGTAGAMFNYGFTGVSSAVVQVNRAGQVFFRQGVNGGDTTTSNDEGLFTGTPGSLSMVLREGDSLGGGLTAAAFTQSGIQMDNSGHALFEVVLGGAVTAASDRSLWLYTPGSGNTPVIREGDPAPGTIGATFNNPLDNWSPTLYPTSLTRSGKFLLGPFLMNGDVVGGVNDQMLCSAAVAA